MVEAAQIALRSGGGSELRDWVQYNYGHKPRPVQVMIVARHLLESVWHMWKQRQSYRFDKRIKYPPKGDHIEMKYLSGKDKDTVV